MINKVGERTWIAYNVSIGDFVVITHEEPIRMRNMTDSVTQWHVVTSDGATLSLISREPTTTVYQMLRQAIRYALYAPEIWRHSDRLRRR